MNKNKGFTLIELLVVIAIIGILASVVLASLSSARDKGKDTAVKSQLASMRAQAELYYAAHNDSYNGICKAFSSVSGFGDEGGPGLLNAVMSSAGVITTANFETATAGVDTSTTVSVTCNSSDDAWAVDAPLVSVPAVGSALHKFYCVDATGASKEEALPITAGAKACS